MSKRNHLEIQPHLSPSGRVIVRNSVTRQAQAAFVDRASAIKWMKNHR